MNTKKKHRARSGIRAGWGTAAQLFSIRNCFTDQVVREGTSSWCRRQSRVRHLSGRFLSTSSFTRLRTSLIYAVCPHRYLQAFFHRFNQSDLTMNDRHFQNLQWSLGTYETSLPLQNSCFAHGVIAKVFFFSNIS